VFDYSKTALIEGDSARPWVRHLMKCQGGGGDHSRLGYMVRILFPLISMSLLFGGHIVLTIFTPVYETAIKVPKNTALTWQVSGML